MRKIIIGISKGKLIATEDSYNLPDLATIKTLRKALNLSQTRLSEITGIPQASISRWELGISEPPYSKAKKIFETLQALNGRIENDRSKLKASVSPLEVATEE